MLLKSPTTYKYSLAGGLKIHWGGGGEPTRTYTPPHSHTPPPPPPTQEGVELGGGGDENIKTINTVTTSKDNAFFSIPLSPLKYRLVNIAALTE